MGLFTRVSLIVTTLLFGQLASAQLLPPTLQALASPIEPETVLNLGPFTELQDLIAEAQSNPRAPEPVGANRVVQLDLDNGEWTPLNNGNRLWRLAIQSPDAEAINVHFSAFELDEGAQLWVYSADQNSVHGPYTDANKNLLEEFWSPQVMGDTIILELEQPAHAESALIIGHIGHGHKAWWREDDSIQTKAAGGCHINVACSQGNSHSSKIRATARIIYSSGLSQFACSGTLLNNTAQDGDPYFLTANHCIGNILEAASATTYWQYQSNSCGSNSPPATNQTVSGSTLVATWATNDFTLLRLSQSPNPNFNPYWSGWDRSGADLGFGVSIHHPAGDVKKISVENDAMAIVNGSSNPADATNAAGRYVRVGGWDIGTTEGGSSGSGIWNPSNRIVGALSAGNADCSNPNGQDFYGWLGQAWEGGGTPMTRLKDWLAPGDDTVVTLDGCDHHNENCSGDSSSTPPTGTTGDPGAVSSGGGGGGNAVWLLALGLLGYRARKF